MDVKEYKNYLRCAQYHWLLGLRTFTKPCQPNLWEQIQKIQPEEVTRIHRAQDKMKQKMWPIRVIYWIFNIESYAEHYYTLNAYNQLTGFQRGDHNMPMNKNSSNGLRGWFRANNEFKLKESIVGPIISQTPSHDDDVHSISKIEISAQNGVSHQLSRSEEHLSGSQSIRAHASEFIRWLSSKFYANSKTRKTASAQQLPLPDEMRQEIYSSIQTDTLLITQSMLSSLELLGINNPVGTLLHSEELRKAFLAQALKFHPDKNPSQTAKEEFVAIAKAYETLKSKFCDKSSSEQPLSFNYDELWKTCDVLSRCFREISRDYREISRDYREISQDYRELTLRAKANTQVAEDFVREYEEKLKKHNDEFKGILQSLNERLGLAVNEPTAISPYAQQSFFKTPGVDVPQKQDIQQNREFPHQ